MIDVAVSHSLSAWLCPIIKFNMAPVTINQCSVDFYASVANNVKFPLSLMGALPLSTVSALV